MAVDSKLEVAVVGAGAAGTWCAWRVAVETDARVTLYEKTPRVGTKILASGGSRCNLTTTLGPAGAGELFGVRGARFLKRAFGALAPADVRTRFGELGVATEEAPLEKIFPSSGSAREVRDALEAAARTAGVHVELTRALTGLTPVRTESAGPLAGEVEAAASRGEVRASAGAGQVAGVRSRKEKKRKPRAPDRDPAGWRLELEGGGSAAADIVVLATGGQSYASTGTTGDGYGWLAGLGLELVEPKPALVPLLSPAGWIHDLKGIALQNASVRLIGTGGKVLQERRRPLLFTHQGLSGPAAMDLSRIPAREGGPFTLRVDLVPDCSRDTLREDLIALAGRPRAPRVLTLLSELLTERAGEVVPKRLVEALLASLGIAPEATMQAVDKAARHRLVEALKGWDLPVDGDAGYPKAEVTSGGLALKEVDPGSCRVRGFGGLYVIGELLDLDGPIGGLNFQSAFATAELAAMAIGERTPKA